VQILCGMTATECVDKMMIAGEAIFFSPCAQFGLRRLCLDELYQTDYVLSGLGKIQTKQKYYWSAL
jgi:hypothetical protein